MTAKDNALVSDISAHSNASQNCSTQKEDLALEQHQYNSTLAMMNCTSMSGKKYFQLRKLNMIQNQSYDEFLIT